MANFFSSAPFQLAGSNFNPAGFNQIFGDNKNRYDELRKKYPSVPYDPSKANTELGILGQALRPDPQYALLQAEIAEAAALRAAELGRQNIDYAIGQQSKYETERDKRRTELALKANLLTSIPQTIAQGFGNIAAMNVLGARNATETMAQTLASYPKLEITAQPQLQFPNYYG